MSWKILIIENNLEFWKGLQDNRKQLVQIFLSMLAEKRKKKKKRQITCYSAECWTESII